MAKKKKMQKLDLENFFVYSTDPQESREEEEIQDEIEPQTMKLLVRKEKKGRGGKVVTVIEGFEGSYEAMKELAKDIKQHCGTGGAVKGDDIVIQGDLAVKIVQYLESRGYPAKKTTM